MNTIPEALRARVAQHLEDEPDAADRRALGAMLEQGDLAALEAAFAGPLVFGTAGLRAAVGPGPAGLNLRNVVRATRALLETLEDTVPDARERGVVVGFDARPSSAPLAEAVITSAAARGYRVHAFTAPVATPLVAFAALELGTAAAVVLTASHNPPSDNGMKVYGPDAAQIVPPFDAAVAARMNDARPTPRPPARADLTPEQRDRIATLGESTVAAHRARCLAIAESDQARAEVRVAYTALHGVGEAPVRAALEALGRIELHSVAEQAEPDGRFPTTNKPNPEEPEALERVLALARRVDASLVLATDPDADRLAVAVRARDEFVVLHGDELGVVFGEHLCRRSRATKPFVATTIVSSPWLLEIARDLGVRGEVTLTGHKWISACARRLEASGHGFVFGYEEAIGYAFDVGVRDKDGIAAAVVIARIATELASEGLTLLDRLESIARTHGMHRSRLGTTRFAGPEPQASMEATLDRLRTAPPRALAGRRVIRFLDGRMAVERSEDGTERPLGLPPSSLLGFSLEDGLRVLLRPSGTEPKLKLYLDLPLTLGSGESYLEARARADGVLRHAEDELRNELLSRPG